MIIVSVISLLFSLFLQGLVSNFQSYTMHDLSIFSAVYMLLTLVVLQPYFENDVCRLSISHTANYVAVLFSRVAEVGIDIETVSNRVMKLRQRIVSSREKADTLYETLLHWSAKETMFKCLNATEVDFREHLHIFPFVVSSEGVFNAVEYRTRQNLHFEIHYRICSDFVLTYTVC